MRGVQGDRLPKYHTINRHARYEVPRITPDRYQINHKRAKWLKSRHTDDIRPSIASLNGRYTHGEKYFHSKRLFAEFLDCIGGGDAIVKMERAYDCYHHRHLRFLCF